MEFFLTEEDYKAEMERRMDIIYLPARLPPVVPLDATLKPKEAEEEQKTKITQEPKDAKDQKGPYEDNTSNMKPRN